MSGPHLKPLSIEELQAILQGSAAESHLADFLAVSPIFDRGLAEILAAIAQAPDLSHWRPIGRADQARQEAVARWTRDCVEGTATKPTSPELQQALAWMDEQANVRSDAVEQTLRRGGFDVMQEPAGFQRVAVDGRRAAIQRWVGPGRLTLVEAALLDRSASFDPLGIDLDAVLAAYYAQRAPAVSPAYTIRHLIAVAPDVALEWLASLVNQAAEAADLATMSHLISTCEERARERPFADPRAAEIVPAALTRLRSRLEARLATVEEFYRTTRYFTRASAHEPLERLLMPVGSTNRPEPWLLQLHAPGGSGKTMLLRWLAARRCAPSNIPIAKIDFDAYALAPDLWEILLSVASLLNRQLPGFPFDQTLARFDADRRDLGQRPGLDAKGRAELAARRQRSARARSILDSTVLESLTPLFRTLPDPSVVVIDTLEEAILTHRTDLHSFLAALETLHNAAPSLRVVLAGRYELTEKDPRLADSIQRHAATRRLQPFDRDESLAFLATRGLPSTDPRASEVATIAEGNPLRLALFAEFVASDPSIRAEDLRDHAKADLIYVTERIIGRIEPSLRWLVRYGVVPRELTFEFVRDVLQPFLASAFRGEITWDDPAIDLSELPPALRRPLFVQASLAPVEDPWLALWRRLQEFASESSWIEAVQGDRERLVFHAVVRRPMLQLLQRHRVLRELHQRAAEHYQSLAFSSASPRGDAAAAAIFHRLRQGEEHEAAALLQRASERFAEQFAVRRECASEFFADGAPALSAGIERAARLEELDALSLSVEQSGETVELMKAIEAAIALFNEQGRALAPKPAIEVKDDYRLLHARAIVAETDDEAARYVRAAIQACPDRRRAGVLHARLARVSKDRRARASADESVRIAIETEGLGKNEAIPAESRAVWQRAFATFSDRLLHGSIRAGIEGLPRLNPEIRDPVEASETILDWSRALHAAGLSDAATRVVEPLLERCREEVEQRPKQPIQGIGSMVAAGIRSALTPPWLFRAIALQAPYLPLASIAGQPTDTHRVATLLEIIRFATLTLNEPSFREATSGALAMMQRSDVPSIEADFACLLAEHELLRIGNIGRAESWLRRFAEFVRSASPGTQLQARALARLWELDAERRADFLPPELTTPVLRYASARAVDAVFDLRRQSEDRIPRLLKALHEIDTPSARALAFEWCISSTVSYGTSFDRLDDNVLVELTALLPVDDEFLDTYGTELDRLRYALRSAAALQAVGAHEIAASRLRSAWVATESRPLRIEPWFTLDLLELAQRSGVVLDEPSRCLERVEDVIRMVGEMSAGLKARLALAGGLTLAQAGAREAARTLALVAESSATSEQRDSRLYVNARAELEAAIDTLRPRSSKPPRSESLPEALEAAGAMPEPFEQRLTYQEPQHSQSPQEPPQPELPAERDPLELYRAEPCDVELVLTEESRGLRAVWRFLQTNDPPREIFIRPDAIDATPDRGGLAILLMHEPERVLRWAVSELHNELATQDSLESVRTLARNEKRSIRVRITPPSIALSGIAWEGACAGREETQRKLAANESAGEIDFIHRSFIPTRGDGVAERRERERTRWLQQALTALGWASLVDDGIAGPQTIEAVRNALRRLGSEQDRLDDEGEAALSRALREVRRHPEAIVIAAATRSSFAATIYKKVGLDATLYTGLEDAWMSERLLTSCVLVIEADILTGSRQASVALDLRSSNQMKQMSSNQMRSSSRVGPEEVDLLLERTPSGERPLIILAPRTDLTVSEFSTPTHARNDFAAQLFQRGNAPAVIALHGDVPGSTHQVVATELARGATIEQIVRTIRTHRGNVRPSMSGDSGWSVALWCHDPRWRPTPGIRESSRAMR